MALVIGVNEGSEFFIQDTRVVVIKVIDALRFRVRVETPAMDYEYLITEHEATVLPRIDWDCDVKISAGLRGTDTLARVVVDAPKNIGVLRGSLYHRGHDKDKA